MLALHVPSSGHQPCGISKSTGRRFRDPPADLHGRPHRSRSTTSVAPLDLRVRPALSGAWHPGSGARSCSWSVLAAPHPPPPVRAQAPAGAADRSRLHEGPLHPGVRGRARRSRGLPSRSLDTIPSTSADSRAEAPGCRSPGGKGKLTADLGLWDEAGRNVWVNVIATTSPCRGARRRAWGSRLPSGFIPAGAAAADARAVRSVSRVRLGGAGEAAARMRGRA